MKMKNRFTLAPVARGHSDRSHLPHDVVAAAVSAAGQGDLPPATAAATATTEATGSALAISRAGRRANRVCR